MFDGKTLTEKQKECIYLLNTASQHATFIIDRVVFRKIEEKMHNLISSSERIIVQDLANGIYPWKSVYEIVMFLKQHLDDQECRDEIAIWDPTIPESQLDKIKNIWKLTPKFFWETVLYDIQSLDPEKYL